MLHSEITSPVWLRGILELKQLVSKLISPSTEYQFTPIFMIIIFFFWGGNFQSESSCSSFSHVLIEDVVCIMSALKYFVELCTYSIQHCSNSEESIILCNVTLRFIWSSLTDEPAN